MKGLVDIVSFSIFFLSSISFLEEVSMASKNLMKLLAGLGVAGLITAGGISLPGAHAGSSGWGAGKDSAGSAENGMKPAGSGWSGSKDSAVSAAKEETKEAVEEGTKKEEALKAEGKEDVKAADEVEKKKSEKSGYWWLLIAWNYHDYLFVIIENVFW